MASPQPEMYKIYCVIKDEDSPFPVDIPSNQTVGDLKKAIKLEKKNDFDSIDADKLVLYPINLAGDDDLDENLNRILSTEPGLKPLNAVKELVTIFGPSGPAKETVHILVQVPEKGRGKKRKRDELSEEEKLGKLTRKAPSSLAYPTNFKAAAEGVVRCNRPFDSDTIPINLLQREFGEFIQDCARPPTSWAQQLLQKLTESACKWHPDETSRRSEIQEVLKDAGLYLRAETISGTEYKTDGNWNVNIMPPAIRECKNEYGCAVFEAIAYYAHFVKNSLKYSDQTRFPCVLLVDVGPCIAFYGCLYTAEHLHVEPLTYTFDLTTHWRQETARNAIASSLDAFRETIGRLEKHYENLATAPLVASTFPYPTSYTDKMGQEIKFTYRERIDEKLVFRVSVDGEVENMDLCVKFTQRYSKEAHETLAELGHAPQLREVTSLPAGWIMVVMDFLPYKPLSASVHLAARSCQVQVGNIVQKLHDKGFVHGDIRDTNILVNPSDHSSLYLIDFDWAGKDQEVRYPARVNTVSVRRPSGVGDGELITKAHDMEMVSFL